MWAPAAESGAFLMAEHYAQAHPEVSAFTVYAIGLKTESYASILAMSDKQTHILLCMAHEESNFRAGILGDHGTVMGVYQTPKVYYKKLRRFWRLRGVQLGAVSDVDTQVAFGVAEFYMHMEEAARAHEGIWGAVRRYNGSGPGARRYVKHVFKVYEKVFKRPREL